MSYLLLPADANSVLQSFILHCSEIESNNLMFILLTFVRCQKNLYKKLFSGSHRISDPVTYMQKKKQTNCNIQVIKCRPTFYTK